MPAHLFPGPVGLEEVGEAQVRRVATAVVRAPRTSTRLLLLVLRLVGACSAAVGVIVAAPEQSQGAREASGLLLLRLRRKAAAAASTSSAASSWRPATSVRHRLPVPFPAWVGWEGCRER